VLDADRADILDDLARWEAEGPAAAPPAGDGTGGGALDGVVVVDLSTRTAGRTAARILAEYAPPAGSS
jgi:hypothetical protein